MLPLARLFGLAVFMLAAAGPTWAEDAAPPPPADKPYGELYERVQLPPGIYKEDYREVLTQVLTENEWTVQHNSDKRVVGYLKQVNRPVGPFKRVNSEATVTLIFGGDAVEIYYEGWELTRAGERLKPELPKGWLENLRKDLVRKFGVLAAKPR